MIAENWRWLALRLAAIPLIFLVVSFVFFFLYYGPFSPFEACRLCSPEVREQTHRALGLDRPLLEQYADWVRDAVRLDFQRSWYFRTSIQDELSERASATAELVVLATIIGTVVGIGLAAAGNRVRIQARAVVVASVAALLFALPVFLIASLSLSVPLDLFDYAPPIGRYIKFREDPWGNLRQSLTPAAVLAMPAVWVSYRAVRSDGGGLAWRAVLRAVFFAMPVTLAGTVLIERVFTIPGLGIELLFASETGDAPLLQFLSTLFVGVWLVAWLVGWSVRTPSVRSTTSRGRRVLVASAFVVAFFILAGILGPYVGPYEPGEFVATANEGPSWAHPLGTTRLGQDVLSRLLAAARPALESATPVLIGVVSGLLVGIVFARVLHRRWPRATLPAARLEATFVPALLIAVALLPVFDYRERGFVAIFAAMSFLLSAYAATVKLHTGQTERDASFVDALRRVASPAAAVFCEAAAVALITRATLDANGLEWDRTTWGGMVLDARSFFPSRYDQIVIPCLPLAIVVLALLLASHELRERATPASEP